MCNNDERDVVYDESGRPVVVRTPPPSQVAKKEKTQKNPKVHYVRSPDEMVDK